MNDKNKTKEQLIQELARLRQRIAELECQETETKHLEQGIVHLASFPELNPSPVLELDQEGNLSYLNPATKSIFPNLATLGVNHPFLVGWTQVIKELQGSNWGKIIVRDVVADGLFFEQVISPVTENRIRIYGRNITERKQAEETMRRLATVVRDSNDAITVHDLEGRIITWNRGAKLMYGYSEGEALQMNIGHLTPPDKEAEQKEFTRRLIAGEAVTSLETQRVTKDGRILDVWLKVTKLVDDDGTIIGIASTERDITERRKMEQLLLVTDRLASIGELASGIAHEINNPLTGILGLSELILDTDVPADVREDLKTIHSEAQRTARIVQNLLTFARKQPQEKQPVNVNDPISKVLELRAYEQKVSNINVITRFAPNLPEVKANAFQLQQVFINIITNAEYFMIEAHNKGTLTIATEQVNDIVRISFADDGLGISNDNLRHLFTPFFTTKEVGKGTGLGLSICHGIVTEHGGRIYAESEVGKGATFIIELPIVSAGSGGTQE